MDLEVSAKLLSPQSLGSRVSVRIALDTHCLSFTCLIYCHLVLSVTFVVWFSGNLLQKLISLH